MSSLRRAFISYNVCASTTTATFETWQQIAARRSSKQTKKSNQFFRLAWRFSHVSTARATIPNEHLITETIFNLLNNIVVVLSFGNLCVLAIYGEIIREKQVYFAFCLTNTMCKSKLSEYDESQKFVHKDRK